MTPDIENILGALADGKVEFILVGGLAATAHGSARSTYDVDVLYERSSDNLVRLAVILDGLQAALRDAPPGLPFRPDVATLRNGLNFTLSTRLGPLDLLGEIAGGGAFADLVPHTVRLNLFGRSVRCLTLQKLIETKRATGRPKDLEALAELEALREEQSRG